MGLFSKKKKVLEVTKPPPPNPEVPDPPVAADEQLYEVEVPPNTKPGSKLKLTVPGMSEKVVITLPPGAEPGRTISFTLPKGKTEVDAKLVEQTKASDKAMYSIIGCLLLLLAVLTFLVLS